MDQILNLLRDEMRDGFGRVTEQLGKMNDTVTDHGAQIAVLDSTLRMQVESLKATTVELDDIAENFNQHRARCPFDRQGLGFTVGEHAELARQVTEGMPKKQVAVAGGIGALVATALSEVLPYLVRKVFP